MNDMQTVAITAAGIGWLLAQIPSYNRIIRRYLKGGTNK